MPVYMVERDLPVIKMEQLAAAQAQIRAWKRVDPARRESECLGAMQ